MFGHSGLVTCKQQPYLKKTPNYNEDLFNNLQKAALLGTIEILRTLVILRFSCITSYSIQLYMFFLFSSGSGSGSGSSSIIRSPKKGPKLNVAIVA